MTTITIDRAVLEQAVEVLSHKGNIYHYNCPVKETIETLRAALNAPQPEPHFAKRWNIQRERNGGLLVCFGDHEQGDACRYTHYVEQQDAPQPEPVAWTHDKTTGLSIPLYTHPFCRKWVGLTDIDEIEDCWPEGGEVDPEGRGMIVSAQWLCDFARAIEQAIKERNK